MTAVSCREQLRDGTADRHRRAQAAMELGDPPTEAAYGRCLERFHALWCPTEAVLARWSADQADPWPAEDRARLARHDLLILGRTAIEIDGLATCTVEPPDAGPPGAPTAFGYAYVLEGSAFGAAVLADQVTRGLPEAPCSFLAPQDQARWMAFTAALDAGPWNRTTIRQAVAATRSLYDALAAVIQELPHA